MGYSVNPSFGSRNPGEVQALHRLHGSMCGRRSRNLLNQFLPVGLRSLEVPLRCRCGQALAIL